jgi:hypothetical protein
MLQSSGMKRKLKWLDTQRLAYVNNVNFAGENITIIYSIFQSKAENQWRSKTLFETIPYRKRIRRVLTSTDFTVFTTYFYSLPRITCISFAPQAFPTKMLYTPLNCPSRITEKLKQ